MFYQIYLFITAISLIVASPAILILSLLKAKYRRSLPARFFLYQNPALSPSPLHFHAASLGEVTALIPIIKALGEQNCRISVITQTGFEHAKKHLKCPVGYLPFEPLLAFWLTRCETLVVFEAELWLALFKTAKNSGAKTILLNARITDKSLKSYNRFALFYRQIFKNIDLVLAQSDIDAVRLKNLGAKNIIVSGNVKSALTSPATKIFKKPLNRRIITIASTHENEEQNILNALISVATSSSLVIAPRHPERFCRVRELCEEFARRHGLLFKSFSGDADHAFSADIAVLDTLGELINLYKISDLVILGGSFEPGIGGHNPIEAAQFNCPIISGKYAFSQKPLFALVDGIITADYETLLDATKIAGKTEIKDKCDLNRVLNILKGQ